MNFLGDPEVKGVTRVTKEKRVFLDFLECWGRKSLSDPASGSRSCLPEDQTNTPCRTLGHTCQKTSSCVEVPALSPCLDHITVGF
ncbi:uncharacterized protein LOC121826022 isoform X4 [Peromyscus maniculatus bairdii]|uniref:uncharacterized protein LOC121826022 isoform X4 n=1 Tax=Peromyscus maniculatus bairdii TaxID=230844 RepID=UPI003FD5BA5D